MCGAMRARIDDFVLWANAEAARQNLAYEVILPTHTAEIGPSRFLEPWPGTSPADRTAMSRWPSNTGTCAQWLSRGDTHRAAATVFTISSTSKPCEPSPTPPPNSGTTWTTVVESRDPAARDVIKIAGAHHPIRRHNHHRKDRPATHRQPGPNDL